jgi:Domain of unknown function (DUF5666)
MGRVVSTSAIFAVCLLVFGSQVQAQPDGQSAPPAGQMGQRGPRGGGQGRGGFGGQRVQGTVTAASADKLTLKTDAGESYTVTVTDNSRIMKPGQPIKLTDVKPGDSVTAMGQIDVANKTVQAMMVMDIDAATMAKAKENLGKTYITGRITAIDADNLKLTVMRTDEVSQVISVDDGTSFQRGNRGVAADVVAAGGLAMGGGFGGGFGGGRGMGRQGGAQGGTPPPPESITLADIKVGDRIMATGAIKNGSFTALKLGVSEPGGPGGGRRGPQEPGAGTPPSPPPPPQ